MCGIIGYVGPDSAGQEARVLAGREEMVHRGPDDAGLWQDGQACLGSRRLSVLDLSQAGHMPMHTDDNRLAIVFNGEIYNYLELRAELVREISFHSTGDTEVILNGFRVWGWPGLLERLDGMFAFAIWDGASRQLFAARDRLGEKPFFYARIREGFGFASTLAALTRLRGAPLRVEMHALDAYLTYQAVPSPYAIFEGCSQLPPAHALRLDVASGVLDISRYWDLHYVPKARVSERDAVDRIEALARKSVRERLRSDVPTGTLLSGGVDSSLITALASEESDAPIDAVTMGYAAPDDADERPFARLVAARYGVRLHETVLAASVVRDLPAIISQYGQPLADVSIVPNFYLAAAARQYMTVALVGDGADEAFGGYARPMIERVAPFYRSAVPSIVRRSVAGLIAEQPGQRESNALLRRMSLLTRAGATSARDAFVYNRGFRMLRHDAYTPEFLGQLGDWHPDSLYHSAWDRADADNDVDRALYGDLTTYLPDQLLAKSDVSAMAHGLEARAPFLSREIIEFAATLPSGMHLHRFRTKYLLKRVAERYVPREALYRRKRGFVIPAARWLRTDLAKYVRAAVGGPPFLDRGWMRPDAVRRLVNEHLDGSHDWTDQIWTLLVLEIWARLTLDGSLAPEDDLEALLPHRTGLRSSHLRAAPAPIFPALTGTVTRHAPLQTLQIGMGWFEESPGGLNRVYAHLVRELAKQDVEILGLVAGTAAVESSSNHLVRGFGSASIPVWQRQAAARRMAKPWLREHPDAIVVSHFAMNALPVLDLLGERPLVVHFQGPWGQESRHEGSPRVQWMAKELLEGRVYRRANEAIVLSNAFRDILATRFRVPENRITVIPGGVEVSRFAQDRSKNDCRAELGWPTDRPIVLCVRRLVRRVGIERLIDAAVDVRRRVPSVLFLIAGAGPIREELEARIVANGLTDTVRLIGFMPDAQLPLAYRGADLTVVPTVALEGFGLIAAESLAAGTPCIVTPVGGLAEIAAPLSPALITESSRPDDIASVLSESLLGARGLPSAEACTAYARARFDWPVIARQVRAVYDKSLR